MPLEVEVSVRRYCDGCKAVGAGKNPAVDSIEIGVNGPVETRFLCTRCDVALEFAKAIYAKGGQDKDALLADMSEQFQQLFIDAGIEEEAEEYLKETEELQQEPQQQALPAEENVKQLSPAREPAKPKQKKGTSRKAADKKPSKKENIQSLTQDSHEDEVHIICPLPHRSASGGPLSVRYGNRGTHAKMCHDDAKVWDIDWEDPDGVLTEYCTMGDCTTANPNGLGFKSPRSLEQHLRSVHGMQRSRAA